MTEVDMSKFLLDSVLGASGGTGDCSGGGDAGQIDEHNESIDLGESTRAALELLLANAGKSDFLTKSE